MRLSGGAWRFRPFGGRFGSHFSTAATTTAASASASGQGRLATAVLLGTLGAGGGLLYLYSRSKEVEVVEVLASSSSSSSEQTLPEIESDIYHNNLKGYQHPMNSMPWYKRWLFKIHRMAYLTYLFVPVACVNLAAYVTHSEGLRNYAIAMLVRKIEAAGCTFQKYGQWVSNRPDMFPDFVVNALKTLCTDSPSHDEKATRKAFFESFGVQIEDVFEEFDMSPIASGSVAQVHSAKLKSQFALKDGQVKVAVKVRHPNVVQETFVDCDVLFYLLDAASYVSTAFSVPFDQKNFVLSLQKQVDLTYEACNLRQFSKNFQNEISIAFPTFSSDLLSPAVLVEGWASGKVVADFFSKVGKDFALVVNQVDRKLVETKSAMADLVFDMAMKMYLRDNLMHGDLHGGNIIYNTEDNEMTVIDVGITCTLNAHTKDFTNFLYGMCTARPEIISQSLLDMSTRRSGFNLRAFETDIKGAYGMFASAAQMQDKDFVVPVGDITGELLRTLNRHSVNLDGEVCSLLISIAMLEGMLRQLNPKFDMMTRGIPYILRYQPGVVSHALGETLTH